MMQSYLNTAAETTKVTENTHRYLQIGFADEDLYSKVLARKWTLSIFSKLATKEGVRFNELRKLMSGITSTVLSDRLSELESEGLISKRIYPEIPPRVEYRLTVQARELGVILEKLGRWAQRWKAPRITYLHA
jgi:DNA-binding HxlR family transcriptional regulator